MMSRFYVWVAALLCTIMQVGLATGIVSASAMAGSPPAADYKQSAGNPELAARLQSIMSRPEFNGAQWGMQFIYPDTKEEIYSLHADELFQPASAVKALVAGTVFSALGPDYRFHTPVYRTGPVVNGVLHGDLVLQASGDMLLGGRINPDGTLALPEPDHTYDMMPGAVTVSSDPLRSIRQIADQIAASGIKSITGRVIVDDSLFREQKGEAGGTGSFTVSPMMINDNLVDVVITPGNNVGDPASIRILPETDYVHIINKTNTSPAAKTPGGLLGGLAMMGPGGLRFVDDTTNADGTHTVTLTGNIALGSEPALRAYRVPEPARFAEVVLEKVLREKGITAKVDLRSVHDFASLATFYKPENKVAEIVSPPLSEELKVMLKISSNPHTVQWPYLVGAIAGHDSEHAKQAGNNIQAQLFAKVGVQPGGDNAKQDDFGWRYSPRSFTNFLTYVAQQPYLKTYMNTLPIMGKDKDGSLANVQPDSPAAGHVYAKTGSGVTMSNASNTGTGMAQPIMHIQKALAGFIELPDGRLVAFAEFLEYDNRGGDIEPANQVMGELAAAVYEYLTSQGK